MGLLGLLNVEGFQEGSGKGKSGKSGKGKSGKSGRIGRIGHTAVGICRYL